MLPKLLDANIGDTVSLKGVVTDILEDGRVVYIKFPGTYYSKGLLSCTDVEDIVALPKVGDHVDVEGQMSIPPGYTVLNIHGDGTPFQDTIGGRRWAVIAFKGDMPFVVHIDSIVRRSQVAQTT